MARDPAPPEIVCRVCALIGLHDPATTARDGWPLCTLHAERDATQQRRLAADAPPRPPPPSR